MQIALVSALKGLGSSKHSNTVRPSVVVASLVALTLFASLSIATSYILGSAQQIVAAEPISTSTNTKTVSDTASATPATQQAATKPSGPIQTCVPASNDTQPAALELSDTPDGLKQQIDGPLAYQIYGTTTDALRTQIKRCAPKSTGSDEASFAAQTIYQLTWQYTYSEDSGGRCRIVQASVGVHVSQVLPLWQPTAGAPAGMTASWKAFISALSTHENGHTALDVQYAQRLLDDLHNFPPTPCGQLAQSVKQLTNQDVAELAQANDNYDSTTNHGATQGAILP